MSLRLRPMQEDEFDAWAPKVRDGYAQAMVEDGGFSPEFAATKADTDMEQLFPEGRPAADQLVFVLEAASEPVGELWLAEREDSAHGRCFFVYDIHVDDAYRGRGYGKDAMRLAEEEARRRGLRRIALNVFGRNTVARNLYRSLGYEENAVAMSKSV